MKVKLSILALALCSLFAFTSCDDDDNNYLPDQTVTKAFDEKYPGVGKVEWETKSGYEVADLPSCLYCQTRLRHHFRSNGNRLPHNHFLFPENVRTELKKSIYADWKYTDYDKLERSNAATVYVIEAEQGEKEVDLYYTEDGVLIKVVNDSENDHNDFYPVVIPQAISDAINEMYPGATVLEFDQEKNGFEVDILHNNIYKDVYFNTENQWVSTEWDITKDQVPAIVMNALQASEYKNYTIDDIDLIEKPEGTFYVFDLEQGDNDVEVTFDSEGNIKSTQKD